MDTYTINKKEYYIMSELMEKNRKMFVGCKNGREFVVKKEVPEEKYIYAKEINGKLKVTDGRSRKFDKIYLSKTSQGGGNGMFAYRKMEVDFTRSTLRENNNWGV